MKWAPIPAAYQANLLQFTLGQERRCEAGDYCLLSLMSNLYLAHRKPQRFPKARYMPRSP